MRGEFKVGDKVVAVAYTDCFGKFHAEVSGLIVDSIRHMPETYGIKAYDRLNCYQGKLGECLAHRNVTPDEVVQVEAAARFFKHDDEDCHAAQIAADGWEDDGERGRRGR